MNPLKRSLLQVRIEDGVETDEIFTVLMGDAVEPRRKFIEDNALDVRNLDVYCYCPPSRNRSTRKRETFKGEPTAIFPFPPAISTCCSTCSMPGLSAINRPHPCPT